jgi:hypothetical protein
MASSMTPFAAFHDRLPAPLAAVARFASRRSTVVMFVAGFLFDLMTMQRIDAITDLIIQLVYLAALTWLLILQHREAHGAWTPPRRLQGLWAYNVDVLHFFYGGLLSAYVVLYFKSSTGARPLIFFSLLVLLMFVNEMPQIRRAGHRLRLGLYAFCVLSFLNYFVPIVVGRMGAWVFLLALLLSAGVVWVVADRLAVREVNRAATRARLFAPAAVVIAVVGVLYVLRLIPPVPLSVQFHGIYHEVRRDGGGYALVYEKPPFWAPWRRDSRPFRQRPGDRLHYFARVFAPAAFSHRVIVRWERYSDRDGEWRTSDTIGFAVSGGRAEGWRGYAMKSNFGPGDWRVTAETDDGRAIAVLSFRVEASASEEERKWVTASF